MDEDPESVKSQPDSSNTQVLCFRTVIEDVDAEIQSQGDPSYGSCVSGISTDVSLNLCLRAVGEKTKVEVYAHSLKGISQDMYSLILDDARAVVKQSLIGY
jgi:hypothetical protein